MCVGPDNEYSVNKRPDRTQACRRPRRAADVSYLRPLVARQTSMCSGPLPLDTHSPVPVWFRPLAVRFRADPRITAVLRSMSRRMRTAEGRLYPCAAPVSTSVEYRWSRHRVVCGRGEILR